MKDTSVTKVTSAFSPRGPGRQKGRMCSAQIGRVLQRFQLGQIFD